MEVPKLWTALLSGQYDLANQLISRGADINELGMMHVGEISYEATLLHYAVATKSDVQFILALLDLGADIDARDIENLTPLHWAAGTGACGHMIELLINQGASKDARDRVQFTPLHWAAEINCIESAQKLIASGASIDAVNFAGMSALHLALMHHSLELVKILISHSDNIDIKDNAGYTPLLRYVETGQPDSEIIQLLLDNGADVNAKSRETNIFSLFSAAKFNRLDSLHLLLKRGARVNEAINTGNTALHVACENGLADVTALLLKFGADLNARNQEGKIPFELLPNSPSSKATAQIIMREAAKHEALGQSLCEGYKQMIQSCENYLRFDQKCREEIKRMQSEKIDIEDSAVSFFYILSIDEKKLVALARNQKIVTAFESSGYVLSLKIYIRELTTKFQTAKKRANFLKRVEDCLSDVLGLGDMLPALIVRKIASYVKYGNLIHNE